MLEMLEKCSLAKEGRRDLVEVRATEFCENSYCICAGLTQLCNGGRFLVAQDGRSVSYQLQTTKR